MNNLVGQNGRMKCYIGEKFEDGTNSVQETTCLEGVKQCYCGHQDVGIAGVKGII